MKFLKNNLKIVIIVIFIIVIFAVIFLGYLLFKKTNDNKVFENNHYSLEYENNWNVTENEDELIVSNEFVSVSIIRTSITNTQRDMLTEDLFDEYITYLEETNDTFELKNYLDNSNTELDYNGIQLLYNSESDEVFYVLIHYEDSIIEIKYAEKKDIFDYYLDSVLNIIWSLEIK